MIYLNNAATSYPKPPIVIEKLKRALDLPRLNKTRLFDESKETDLIEEAREIIGKFFNIDNNFELIFTSGATEALNYIINGIELKNGNVIATATEHNSTLRPLKRLETKNNLEIRIAECDKNGFISFENILKNFDKNTKAVFINQMSNVTGIVQDLKELYKLREKNNFYLIVDGSQSAGNIEINISDTNIDFFVFTGHKSLFGLEGTGGFIKKRKIKLEPLKVGGTGLKSYLLTQPEEFPHFYESGTQNILGILSMRYGIEYIKSQGIVNIYSVKKKYIEKIKKEFINIDKIKIYNSDSDSCILAFNIKMIEPDEIAYILDNSFDIIIRAGLHCAPLIHKYIGCPERGCVRVSPSNFNNESDIDIFINSIKSICNNL